MSNSPRFLLDENIPKSVKRFLEAEKFSSECVPKGITDSKAASLAKKKKRVLVSRDADFINASLFPPKECPGIIVFAIHPPKHERLVRALSRLLAEVRKFKGKLFIVRDEGFEVIDE